MLLCWISTWSSWQEIFVFLGSSYSIWDRNEKKSSTQIQEILNSTPEVNAHVKYNFDPYQTFYLRLIFRIGLKMSLSKAIDRFTTV